MINGHELHELLMDSQTSNREPHLSSIERAIKACSLISATPSPCLCSMLPKGQGPWTLTAGIVESRLGCYSSTRVRQFAWRDFKQLPQGCKIAFIAGALFFIQSCSCPCHQSFLCVQSNTVLYPSCCIKQDS